MNLKDCEWKIWKYEAQTFYLALTFLMFLIIWEMENFLLKNLTQINCLLFRWEGGEGVEGIDCVLITYLMIIISLWRHNELVLPIIGNGCDICLYALSSIFVGDLRFDLSSTKTNCRIIYRKALQLEIDAYEYKSNLEG